ncbi:hypothetical protein [Vannielia sp.]|uniref:hypothetical protein n=1 Tax=Vannielia sp. TaxID=2813045 RepID=UPI0026288137|nr:hypothetical protein [Vannielia sp.]MDF1871666.1 hypothetical protein [Vannielia sp.]
MNFRKFTLAACLAATQATTSATAADFMDPVFTKMALDAAKPGWVAIRVEGAQDFVFFTALTSWRCGLQEVHYGFNDDPPTTELEMGECHTEFANPNVMLDDDPIPLVTAPAKSVESVTVRLVYRDGALDQQKITRKEVLMP